MPVKKPTTQSSNSEEKPKRKPRKKSGAKGGTKKRTAASPKKRASTPRKTAKRPSPKKTVAAQTASTRTPTVEQEIAQAIERIPQFLQEEARAARTAPVHTPVVVESEPASPPRRIRITPPPRQKYRLLWLGVGIISLAVFGMWTWSMMSMIYDAQNFQHQNRAPWHEAGDELKHIMDSLNADLPEPSPEHIPITTTTTGTPPTEKEKIEQALRALINREREKEQGRPDAPTSTSELVATTTPITEPEI